MIDVDEGGRGTQVVAWASPRGRSAARCASWETDGHGAGGSGHGRGERDRARDRRAAASATARRCWRWTSSPTRRPGRAVRRRPHDARGQPRRGRHGARRFGRLDAVIPNAGFQHVAPVEEFPEDRWDAMLALLLTSPFLLARAAWPALRESGDGRFVAIASVHGLVASPFKSAYVSAKHGAARAGQDAGAGGRRAGHPRHRRLPRLRAHAAGREPGRRPGARRTACPRSGCSRTSSSPRTPSSG